MGEARVFTGHIPGLPLLLPSPPASPGSCGGPPASLAGRNSLSYVSAWTEVFCCWSTTHTAEEWVAKYYFRSKFSLAIPVMKDGK